jgi:hypothetical protein
MMSRIIVKALRKRNETGLVCRSAAARTIHDSSWRNRPERTPREAYLVIRARLARGARKTELAESFIFASRACRARLACLADASGTTSDEVRRSGESAIAAEAFMNNVGKSLQKMAHALDHFC